MVDRPATPPQAARMFLPPLSTPRPSTDIMALKFKFKSREEIPAAQAGLYVERDGVWFLDVDGAVDRTKLDEVNSTNSALAKERDELKQRFEGINPDEVRQLAEEKRKLEEAAQLKAGEFEKVIEARVKAVRTDFDKQLGAVTNERDALHSRLVSLQIDQGVVAAATQRGLRPTALLDITSRARGVFKLVNGVPTAFEDDGQTVRQGKDGAMTLAEWVDAQVSEAPHLFESNAGGGSSATGGGRPVGSTRNPFRRESWNVTEQMKLQKTDPALAARLKASA